MTFVVHLPPALITRVNRRAQGLGVSRSVYIRKALEKALEQDTRWSLAFLAMLKEAASDVSGAKAVDELRTAILSRRTRKSSPKI